MKKMSYQRICEAQQYLAPLGNIRHRALFGGYSLAIDDTVFAMVAEGELYLRVCEQSASYQATHPARPLMLLKRGRPVALSYYHVDEALWRDRAGLLRLSGWSLQDARREKCRRHARHRLKDLPNITFHLEILLQEAGIPDAGALRKLGAESAWFRLKALRKNLSANVLYALEGAIVGVHAATLPVGRRRELAAWLDSLTAASESYSG